MGVHFKPNDAETAILEALNDPEPWRAKVRSVFESRGLPTRRDEDWKWSDVRKASRDITGHGELLLRATTRPRWARLDMPADDTFSFGALAHAAAKRTALFDVHSRQTLDIDFSAGKGVSFASVLVNVKPNSIATVVERYQTAAQAMAMVAVQYSIGRNAELERLILIDENPDAIVLSTSGVTLAEGAKLHQTAFTFGGKLFRQETRLQHGGHDAEAAMNAVYLLGEGRHADFTSLATMAQPDGTLEQLAKGAVAKGGHGVFQGKILVNREAQKTDAQMNHRGLLLEEGAEIDAKPELEIYADDVACAHGNAIGALDDLALFYMRQRGLTEDKARGLLIESFLSEPLEAIRHEKARSVFLDLLKKKLERMA
ncbi:SufD family Fe-S cluster assembly protein [Hyphobacterium sp.]|uniref:SufB/SufD family protein n=1 Tax=Hyphobacterium sp. TaxID=2004662 RepID=UPI003BAA1FF8